MHINFFYKNKKNIPLFHFGSKISVLKYSKSVLLFMYFEFLKSILLCSYIKKVFKLKKKFSSEIT